MSHIKYMKPKKSQIEKRDSILYDFSVVKSNKSFAPAVSTIDGDLGLSGVKGRYHPQAPSKIALTIFAIPL